MYIRLGDILGQTAVPATTVPTQTVTVTDSATLDSLASRALNIPLMYTPTRCGGKTELQFGGGWPYADVDSLNKIFTEFASILSALGSTHYTAAQFGVPFPIAPKLKGTNLDLCLGKPLGDPMVFYNAIVAVEQAVGSGSSASALWSDFKDSPLCGKGQTGETGIKMTKCLTDRDAAMTKTIQAAVNLLYQKIKGGQGQQQLQSAVQAAVAQQTSLLPGGATSTFPSAFSVPPSLPDLIANPPQTVVKTVSVTPSWVPYAIGGAVLLVAIPFLLPRKAGV